MGYTISRRLCGRRLEQKGLGKRKWNIRCCSGPISWARWNTGRHCWTALVIWGRWPPSRWPWCFLYSWIGVALGGTLMFLLWRRIVKRCFWKIAGRWPKLEKAQQWVNHFDTSSLFMLMLLPFAPSSFMHLAFGISDFDEKRYLITMLLGKGVMVAMMALFGQSLVSAMKNPFYLVLAIAIWAGMYFASKHFCKKHEID